MYDVLRADRGVAAAGLEARVPFLHRDFVSMYLELDPELRTPRNGKEKWLLRQAHDNIGLLPDEVLWRKKEAFSDGVSSTNKSWYQIMQQYCNELYTDADLEEFDGGHCKPTSKEALHYRKLFDAEYPGMASVIPKYWLPNWCGGVTEPSARVLQVYKNNEE